MARLALTICLGLFCVQILGDRVVREMVKHWSERAVAIPKPPHFTATRADHDTTSAENLRTDFRITGIPQDSLGAINAISYNY
jgi:hypothetical protein